VIGPALALKLLLTPSLVGAASLAGRRWGDTIGGWLVGLPFTSGPVVLFLALEHGTPFAAVAAGGILAGTWSQAAYAVVLARTAVRGWPAAVAAGTVIFAMATAALSAVALTPWIALVLVAVSLLAATRVLRPMPRAAEPVHFPAWDLPLRMAVTTALVLALTGAASILGARLSGLLAPFPLYATVLAVFAHRSAGPAAAEAVMRGLIYGLFGFTGFFFVLALALNPLGLAATFALALLVALVSQAITLAVIRRS
jgi:hypothetical protein